MTGPTVSAVVYWERDSPGGIQDTLQSLAAQTRLSDETLVVETGRPEPEVMWLRGLYRQVPLLSLARGQGRAYALDCGLRVAQGELVLLVIGGVMLAPDALEQLVGALAAQPQAAIAHPLLLVAESDNFVYAAGNCLTRGGWVVPCRYGERASQWSNGKRGGALPNETCLLVRRGMLADRERFLDLRFVETWGVADLSCRLLAAGAEVVLVPQARAWQPYDYPERTTAVRRARLRLAAKLLPWRRLLLCLGHELLRDSYLALGAFSHRNRREGMDLVRKWLGQVRYLPEAWRERRGLARWYRKAAAHLDGGAPARAPRLSTWPTPDFRLLRVRRLKSRVHPARFPSGQVSLGWEPMAASHPEGLVAQAGATVFLPWRSPLLTPAGQVSIEYESGGRGRLEVEINGQLVACGELQAGPGILHAPLPDGSQIQRVSLYPLGAPPGSTPPRVCVHTISIGWEGGQE